MFPILEGKLRENRITREGLATFLGVSVATVSSKMNGHSVFTLPEARKIRKFLRTDLTIEELFYTPSDKAS